MDKTSDRLRDPQRLMASAPGQSSQTWRAWSFLVIRTTFWTKGRDGIFNKCDRNAGDFSIWTQQSSGLQFEMVQLMFNSDSFHTWGTSTFQTHRVNSIIFVHLSNWKLFLSVFFFWNMFLWSVFCVHSKPSPARWQHLSFVRVYVRKFCIFAGWAAARHEMR